MKQFQSIQALRTIAAWSVVLGHMGTQAPSVLGRADYLSLFIHKASVSFMNAGVDLFFVISGFIMFTVTQTKRQPDRFRECGDFLVRRVLRIYPLFWVTFFFTLLPQPVIRWGDWQTWFWQLWLLDIPRNHGVAWSLVVELRFYAMVALLLLLFRNHIRHGYVVLSLGVVAASVFTSYGALPASFFTMNLMLEFIMGVGVAALISMRANHFALTSLVWGSLWLLLSIGFLYSSATTEFVGASFAGNKFPFSIEEFRIVGFGAPAALIVYGLTSLETTGSINIPKLLSRAGDASYSVYLWHPVIITVIAEQLRYRGITGLACFYSSSVLAVALVAWLSYRWIERPLVGLANRIPWQRNSGAAGAVQFS